MLLSLKRPFVLLAGAAAFVLALFTLAACGGAPTTGPAQSGSPSALASTPTPPPSTAPVVPPRGKWTLRLEVVSDEGDPTQNGTVVRQVWRFGACRPSGADGCRGVVRSNTQRARFTWDGTALTLRRPATASTSPCTTDPSMQLSLRYRYTAERLSGGPTEFTGNYQRERQVVDGADCGASGNLDGARTEFRTTWIEGDGESA